MKDLIKLDNIGNPEVLENITNWREIKNHVKIRNEKGDPNRYYRNTKSMREYYEQLHANKFNNLEEMDNFLET